MGIYVAFGGIVLLVIAFIVFTFMSKQWLAILSLVGVLGILWGIIKSTLRNGD